MANRLLLESGSVLLLESGSALLLETAASFAAITDTVGVSNTLSGNAAKSRSLSNAVGITDTVVSSRGFGDVIQHPTHTVSSANVSTFATPAFANAPAVGNTDFLFAISSATITTPAGYVRDQFDTSNAGIYIFRRIVQAGDTGAAVTLTVGTRPTAVARLELRGVHVLENSNAKFFSGTTTQARTSTAVSAAGRNTLIMFATDEATTLINWPTINSQMFVLDTMVPSGGTSPRNGVLAWGQLVPSGSTTITATSNQSNTQYQILVGTYRQQAASQTFTFTEAVGITDTVATAATKARTVTDSVGISNTVSAAVASSRSLANTVGVTDSLSAHTVELRACSDTVGITDVLSATGTRSRTCTDAVGITDSVSAAGSLSRVLSDAVGVTDLLVVQLAKQRSFSNQVGVTDTLSAGAGLVQSFADPVGITDALSIRRAQQQSFSNLVGVEDTISSSAALSWTFADAVDITAVLVAIRESSTVVGLSDTIGISATLDAETPLRFLDVVGVTATTSTRSTLRLVCANAVGITDSLHVHSARPRPFIKSPTTATIGSPENFVLIRSGTNSIMVADPTNAAFIRAHLTVAAISDSTRLAGIASGESQVTVDS